MADDDRNKILFRRPTLTDGPEFDEQLEASLNAAIRPVDSVSARPTDGRTGQVDVKLGPLTSDGGDSVHGRSPSGAGESAPKGSLDASATKPNEYVLRAESGSFSINGGEADMSRWAPGMPAIVPPRPEAARSSATISPAPAVARAAGSSSSAATGTSHGQSIAIRGGMDTTRSVLNADQYAAVVADVLGKTRDEVCFALFGAWGRGKTHLAKLIEQKLTDHHDSVWFSAWKYRTRPELWAFLYETFRERLSRDGWRVALPRAFRAGVARHGIWGVHAFLFGFALSLFPLAYLAYFVVSVLGVLTVLRVVSVYRGQRAASQGLSQRYFRHVSHEDKLGLQGALAADLRAVVLGALRPVKIEAGWLAGWLYGLLILFVITAGHFAFHGPGVIHVPWLDDLRWTLPQSSLIALGVTFVAESIMAPFWLLRSGVNAKRLLLIVDDLDRTSDDEALEIVESLKLFLEEDGIAAKLQILILCQEDTLSRAISRKYQLHPLDVHEIDDAMQKLFMGHLRLSSLDDKQQSDLFDHLMKQHGLERGETKQPVASDASTTTPASPSSSGWLQRIRNKFRRKKESAQDTARPPLITEDEAKVLEEALRTAVAAGARPPGPRAMQCYLFRYTLARQLLIATRAMPDPKEIAVPLARAILQGDRDMRTLQAPVGVVLSEVA